MFFRKKPKPGEKFQEAALEHLDALYGTALRMTANEAEAEDLVQDTYVRALRFAGKFEEGTNLKAWMFKMMVNLFINRYRRDRRLREVREGTECRDMVERTIDQDKLSLALAPEEYFFEKLFSDDVVRALAELPLEFKLVVLLVDINGFSYARGAEILGIPMGTVMSRLHRGRRLLRASLYEFALREGYVKEESNSQTVQPADLDQYRQHRRGH